ncbi:hypothetical protein BDW22DRAFT_265823 [Trametopsis cervina]|nr:hypothetical protein BDW22DRAFT_265823 [Trametopsis cervina]
MALPSRPNARLNGLPSGPRSRSQPRSASVTREQTRTPVEYSPNPPTQLRHQKSLSNMSEGRRGRWERDAPPVPALPIKVSSSTTERLARGRGERRGSDGSTTTTSSTSSGSSGAPSGYSTPATTVDPDDYDDEDKYEEMQEEKAIPRGFGYSLWSRLQTAAVNLSVNVGKSLEHTGGGSSGETTPPGQESRITRALKAYHIAQASRPSDLPEWLFDEKERGVSSRLQTGERELDDERREAPAQERPRPPVPTAPTRAAAPIARPEYKKPLADEEDRSTMSRAAQRLKEMRDAKALPRKQTIKFADNVHPRRAVQGADRQEPSVPPAPVPTTAQHEVARRVVGNGDASGRRPPAVGLPSGVRPVRRTQ